MDLRKLCRISEGTHLKYHQYIVLHEHARIDRTSRTRTCSGGRIRRHNHPTQPEPLGQGSTTTNGSGLVYDCLIDEDPRGQQARKMSLQSQKLKERI
jgi:hypothetical protein